MIFLAVGTQLPFDRLVRAVDAWAVERGRQDVVGQIGDARFVPAMVRARRFIEPAEFSRLVADASVLIAHAGMGSILGAIELSKPIIIMPRSAALGEHRNDHQLATAERFSSKEGVHVAWNEGDIAGLLDRERSLRASREAGGVSPQLIGAIRDFIAG